MRSLRAKICRSAMGRSVFCCALLLVGAYVLFDILDVDGSQMISRPTDAILSVGPQQADADRFLRTDGTPLGTGDSLIPLPSRLSSVKCGGVSAATIPLRFRQGRLLPRVNLHSEMALSPTPSIDPA
jgi:hypothetical protein